MDIFDKYIKSYAYAGLSISLASGLLRFVAKINVGSGSNLESMGKIFLLVTVTGSALGYINIIGKKENEKLS